MLKETAWLLIKTRVIVIPSNPIHGWIQFMSNSAMSTFHGFGLRWEETASSALQWALRPRLPACHLNWVEPSPTIQGQRGCAASRRTSRSFCWWAVGRWWRFAVAGCRCQTTWLSRRSRRYCTVCAPFATITCCSPGCSRPITNYSPSKFSDALAHAW